MKNRSNKRNKRVSLDRIYSPGEQIKRISNVGNLFYSDNLFSDYLTSGFSIGKGASAPDLTAFRDGLFLNAFAGTGGTTEEAFFSVHILHDFKAKSVPTFHIHWSHNVASPSGNIKWSIEYSLTKGYEAGTFPASTTVTTTQTVEAQYTHHITDDDDMLVVGTMEPDTIVVCRIFRDPTDSADTFGNDAFLLFVDLHFEKGQIGTEERNRPFELYE